MITLLFFAILAASIGLTLIDWRRGWYAAVVCGVLQDPVRKLTPGTPAALSMSIVAVYAVILFAAIVTLRRNRTDFERRFPRIYALLTLMLVTLVLAATNGVVTFGLSAWKAPALSLLIYLIPIPAILLGYSWLGREEQLTSFFTFYAILTAAAMTGTVLEYLSVQSPLLGVVAMPGSYIRHLTGIQIRVLSGIYRAPDIMGWHAAMLTCVGISMALRARSLPRGWPWVGVAAWGFLNCLISGRRKAVYMVAVFSLVFFWRYFRRLKPAQFLSVFLLVLAVAGVMRRIESSDESRVYAQGTRTTAGEVLQRLEGGFRGTLRQSGIFGAGLGAATQGVRHVTGREHDYGWQEGGLGKLTVELGLPGLAAVALLGWALLGVMLRISAVGDLPGTSQIMRTALFGMVVANVINFLASAQAYSDPLLTLMTAFLVGCLFATSRLDETARERAAAQASSTLVPAPSFGR